MSFYEEGEGGETRRRGQKRTCLPLTTPHLHSPPHTRARAGILAVICAKLRGCIFSSAFWDCIPRIASNFCPLHRLAILSTTMVWRSCVRMYVYIYIPPLRTSIVARGFSQAKRKNEAFFLAWWTLGGEKWSGKRNKFFLRGRRGV